MRKVSAEPAAAGSTTGAAFSGALVLRTIGTKCSSVVHSIGVPSGAQISGLASHGLHTKLKPCCAQRLPALNAFGVFGSTAAFTVSPISAISTTTDSTEFTTPPTQNRRGEGNFSHASDRCAGDVKGCAGVPDPLLGLCIR